MISFKQYITEADYTRFLKKNKNLSKQEVEIINKYFSKTNRKAGKDFAKKHNFWQDKSLLSWDYEDYKAIMVGTPSGRKATFKKQSVPGKRNKDYVEVKLKDKGFQGVIPLNHDTAKYLNSSKYGCAGADYCIGWDHTGENWDDIVIDNQQVPVYITNGAEKWVVTIYPDNKFYDVWDKMNNYERKNNTTIPGFDIRKNLFTSSLKKLYDEIREEFYTEDEKTEDTNYDWSEAAREFDEWINDIEDARAEVESNEESIYGDMEKIKDRTLEVYKEKTDKLQELSDYFEESRDEVKEKLESGVEPYTFDDRVYTESEYKELLATLNKKFDEAYDEWNEMDDAVIAIGDMNPHEMAENYDEYEWEGDVPNEDILHDLIHDVETPDMNYLGSEFEYWLEYSGADQDIEKLMYDISDYVHYDEGGNADSIFRKYGIYYPSE